MGMVRAPVLGDITLQGKENALLDLCSSEARRIATMTMEIAVVFAILGISMLLFVTGWIRAEMTLKE